MSLKVLIAMCVVVSFVHAQEHPYPTSTQVFSHPECTQAEILEQLGYTYVPCFGRYKVHKKRTTWDDAKKICENEGTHLVIIETQNEETIVLKLLNLVSTNQWVYIGVHQPGVLGQPWKTVLGDVFNTTLSFNHDVKRVASQWVLFLNRGGGDLGWNTRVHSVEFICELEL